MLGRASIVHTSEREKLAYRSKGFVFLFLQTTFLTKVRPVLKLKHALQRAGTGEDP